MSADVWIEAKACESCGVAPEGAELNITYNLSGMLCEAGFIGWSAIGGMDARKVGVHILAILDHMRADEPRWRAMNPENGWGDYDKCVQGRMRQWAKACAESPQGSTVGASL